MPDFDKKNPYMPQIAGEWDLCPDCAPFNFPCCSDCKIVEEVITPLNEYYCRVGMGRTPVYSTY